MINLAKIADILRDFASYEEKQKPHYDAVWGREKHLPSRCEGCRAQWSLGGLCPTCLRAAADACSSAEKR